MSASFKLKIMRTKHIFIEILPRFLWIAEGVILFFTAKTFGQDGTIFNYLIFWWIASMMMGLGVLSLIWTFVYLPKPMFTKELMTKGS